MSEKLSELAKRAYRSQQVECEKNQVEKDKRTANATCKKLKDVLNVDTSDAQIDAPNVTIDDITFTTRIYQHTYGEYLSIVEVCDKCKEPNYSYGVNSLEDIGKYLAGHLHFNYHNCPDSPMPPTREPLLDALADFINELATQ